VECHVGFKHSPDARALHVPEGIASVQTFAGKARLGLHDGLEDPLHHVAASLVVNHKFVCACCRPICRLNCFEDTARCYLGDGAAYAKGALRMSVSMALLSA
jgi:hypothetical protein